MKNVGIEIESIWDLVNGSFSYSAAIPILINHLSEPYGVKNKEGIARSLAVKEAKGIACEAIIEEYKKTSKENFNYRWVLGNTMNVIVTKDYIEDIINIVSDESNGDSRQMFIRALTKFKVEAVKEIIHKLMNDKSMVIRNEAMKCIRKFK